jgi:hypothetical protein
MGKPSAITEAIKALGSVRKVAQVADCTTEAIYLARARGRLVQARPVFRLAEALHSGDPIRQLATAKRLAGLD